MKSEGLAGLTTVSVDWEEPAVIILDQTQLPNREAYLRLYTPEEIWEAIYHLKVRGAPAIGVAAAYGITSYCCKFIYGFGPDGKMCFVVAGSAG